jgi:hypothetical protein
MEKTMNNSSPPSSNLSTDSTLLPNSNEIPISNFSLISYQKSRYDDWPKEIQWLVAHSAELSNGILITRTLAKNGKEFMQVVVPKHLRKWVFDHVHNSEMGGGHFWLAKSLRKSRPFTWYRKLQDFATWTKQCPECQLRKKAQPKAPLRPMHYTTVMERVAVDLCGPMPETARGNKYIVNFIDCFTKYVISVPSPDARSETIAKLFVNEVVLKYGAPMELLSDNATTFTSQTFQDLCRALNTRKVYCTPYHSECRRGTHVPDVARYHRQAHS